MNVSLCMGAWQHTDILAFCLRHISTHIMADTNVGAEGEAWMLQI